MSQLRSYDYYNYNDFLSNHLTFDLYQQFCQSGKHFFKKNFGGLVEDVDLFYKELEQLAPMQKCFDQIDEDDMTRIYFFDHCFVNIFVPKSNKITVEVITDDEALMNKISAFFHIKFKEVKKEQQIHMIAPDEFSEQTTLYPMGDVSSELNRQNYNEDVLKKVDYVVKELNSENPCGRLVLLDGPPGSGKSYMIRGILKELTYGVCVLVPVSMLESIDKPTFIPLLMKQRRSKRNRILKEGESPADQQKPIVLIIEDADSVLAPRQADNMSAISSLLNYADGIFGSIFDLRIIATTNALHVEIEPALLRANRLLKRIHVGLLSPTKAAEIFKSLTGTERVFEKEISLANVYSLAKGNEPDIDDTSGKKENTMGFQG